MSLRFLVHEQQSPGQEQRGTSYLASHSSRPQEVLLTDDMLKKPNVLFSSYANAHCLYCSNLNSVNKSNYSVTRRQGPRRFAETYYECYATTSSTKTPHEQTNPIHWPKSLHPRTSPSPYQILCTKQGAPYSKKRFYELAKIYHPDRNGHADGPDLSSGLTGAVKMERYRLIVTAHEILSDPAKRKAYDTTGAGWDGRPDHGAPNHDWGQNYGTRWSGFDRNDSPFNCATWEDWERWYLRGKAKQEPVYFSNGGFLVLVIAVVFLGGFGQSVRVGDYSSISQRQVGMIHDDASKALRLRKTESTGFENRDERLQKFLEVRDPAGYSATDPSGEGSRNLPPDNELCIK